MSTRCHIKVIKDNRTCYVYHHTDGYPEGVGEELRGYLRKWCGSKEEFTAEDFCTYLENTNPSYEFENIGIHGDEEYLYTVDFDKGDYLCDKIGGGNCFSEVIPVESKEELFYNGGTDKDGRHMDTNGPGQELESLPGRMDLQQARYPLGNQSFEKIISDGKYYVDKTALIYRMTHTYNYVFLSRPRRFGKSLLCSTLASYFRGEKELFKGLSMERLEKEWKRYPVIHLSLASVKETNKKEIDEIISNRLKSIEKEFGFRRESNGHGERLYNLIVNCYEKYGERVVVILDEYDAPLLNVLHEPERLKEVRQTMRTLFSPLKDCDRYLRFLFITGITKFSQLSIFSELNNLTLISMDDEYSTLCGFTQQELESVFKDGINDLAAKKGLTREQTLDELRQTYDGYHFSAESTGVYNPYSIVYALAKKKTENYWFSTGTPSFLIDTLKEFHTDIADIDGSNASAGEFDAPTENMHSILPLFYQSGYLTIKDYDPEFSIYTLGYPNKEVRTGLLDALYPFYVTANTEGKSDTLRSIVKGFRNHDLDQVFQTLQAFLEGIPYQDSHFDENHWTQMLYVVFSLLGIYTESQVRTAKGRIDIVVKTADDIYVMEVKLDRPVKEALEQIDTKSYLIPYTIDGRRLTKIGMTFSTTERNVTEWEVC
jgi:hypothetical protein